MNELLIGISTSEARTYTNRYEHLVKVGKVERVRYSDDEQKAAEWSDIFNVVIFNRLDRLNFPERLTEYGQYTIEDTKKKTERVSSFRGMYYDTDAGLWNAAFISKGITYECGKYPTRLEAREAVLNKKKAILTKS